jgi:hypothetical protein
MQSELIRGNQSSSDLEELSEHEHLMRDAIRGHRRQSELIRSRRTVGARAPDEGCNQSSSEAIRAHQISKNCRSTSTSAIARVSLTRVATLGSAKISLSACLKREALDRHQWSSVVIRGHQWMREALDRHQAPSAAISGHQWPSVAISGHQLSSVVISGHQVTISGHQGPSGAIRDHYGPSGAISANRLQSDGHQRVIRGPSEATIRGH